MFAKFILVGLSLISTSVSAAHTEQPHPKPDTIYTCTVDEIKINRFLMGDGTYIEDWYRKNEGSKQARIVYGTWEIPNRDEQIDVNGDDYIGRGQLYFRFEKTWLLDLEAKKESFAPISRSKQYVVQEPSGFSTSAQPEGDAITLAEIDRRLRDGKGPTLYCVEYGSDTTGEYRRRAESVKKMVTNQEAAQKAAAYQYATDPKIRQVAKTKALATRNVLIDAIRKYRSVTPNYRVQSIDTSRDANCESVVKLSIRALLEQDQNLSKMQKFIEPQTGHWESFRLNYESSLNLINQHCGHRR